MSYSASESRVREELSALQAAGDELSQKAAAALQTLLDDLAQAHADAASATLNNEQRFHQLEQETITARCEAEASVKLKDEALKQKQQLQDQVAGLNNEISSMQKKINDTNAELQRVNAQLQEEKRDKDELVWTHERRSQVKAASTPDRLLHLFSHALWQEAEKAKDEANQLRKRSSEQAQERQQLLLQIEEIRDSSLKTQASS